MFRKYASRNRIGVAVLAGLSATALAGCGGHVNAHGSAHPTSKSPAAAQPAVYNKARLASALMTHFDGTARSGSAVSGTIGQLQDKLGLQRLLRSIRTSKRECLTAGPNLASATIRRYPAAAATFVDRKRGLSLGEVLFSANTRTRDALLGRSIPSGCRHFTAHIGKVSVQMSLRKVAAPKIGDRATGSVLTVRTQHNSRTSWTVLFFSRDFGGSVSLSGRKANSSVLDHAAVTAYRAAAHRLNSH